MTGSGFLPQPPVRKLDHSDKRHKIASDPWHERGESYRLIPPHKLEKAFGVDRKTVERAIARLGYLYRQLAADPKEAKRQREAAAMK